MHAPSTEWSHFVPGSAEEQSYLPGTGLIASKFEAALPARPYPCEHPATVDRISSRPAVLLGPVARHVPKMHLSNDGAIAAPFAWDLGCGVAPTQWICHHYLGPGLGAQQRPLMPLIDGILPTAEASHSPNDTSIRF